MTNKAIQVNEISKSFGKGKKKKCVLAGDSFEVREKEIFGFLGPNGAGKSTTIKLLLGFLKPDSGSMRVGGKLVGKEEYRHFIGYLPEFPFFYTHLTARETLMLSGRLSGMKKKDISRRSEELLSELDLVHALNQRVGSFSKGMKQRLGMANALIHDPAILIFDEPMSGLDPLGRYLIKDLILKLKKAGKTVFFSSHILSDIEELCDQIALIHSGHLLYAGDLAGFGIKKGGNLESRFIELISEECHALTC